MWETSVQSLGWEDPLEEGMATHSSILAWKIPWKEKPGGLQSMDHKQLDTTEQLSVHACMCVLKHQHLSLPKEMQADSLSYQECPVNMEY